MARKTESRLNLNLPLTNSSVATLTTPTLTPTTLRLLEDYFTGPHHGEPMEHQYQAGFVPPTVTSSITSDSCDDSQFDSEGDLSRDVSPNNLAINQDNSNSSSGLAAKDRTPADEELKKKQRRERNKQAAARCRQRRIEYTNKLAKETEALELGNIELKNTLQGLIQQKLHLENTLKMHNQKCRQAIS